MKRLSIIFMLFFVIFPVLAQSDDFATYEFDTGTTIDYPSEWETELSDGVLAFIEDSQSRGLVIDYPLVFTLSELGAEISGIDAVEALSNILLDTQIDRQEIYEFKLGVRNVAAFDIEGGISGSVFSIEFSNGAMGMLVTIGLDEDVENTMLESFDNTEEVASTFSASYTTEVRTVYGVGNGQRVVVPAGWTLNAITFDEMQYLGLNVADDDLLVQLFDLSSMVSKGTDLEDVLDSSGIDWEGDFAFEIDSEQDDYYFGDREAISYGLTIDGSQGILIILRFSDGEIGMVTVTGTDADEYELEISQIIGSFNNLGAAAQFMQ